MNIDQMDEDLKRFNDFEQLSERVNYWRRRLGITDGKEWLSEEFDAVVAEHSRRVLSVFRAG